MDKENPAVGRWKPGDLMLFLGVVKSDLERTGVIEPEMQLHACKFLGEMVETVTFDKEYLGAMIGTYAVGNEENKLDVIRNINYALELLHKEKVLHDPTVSISPCE